MHDSHYNDGVLFDAIEHIEGKSVGQRAVCVAVHGRIQLWMFDDELQSPKNLIKELLPQTSTLLFVPSRSVLEIVRGLGANTDRQVHRRLRIPASTSSSGWPGSRSIS